jgi:Retinoblastoma-associated protein A domain
VTDFAQRRLHIGETLYFKVLEKILVSERQRICATSDVKSVDLSVSFAFDVG